MEQIEKWKDIPGYENLYQVSDLGNVRRLKSGKFKFLKFGTNPRGYKNVSLSKSGKVKTYLVHILVSICFLDHIPNGHTTTVDHINEIKSDNRLSNLQLLTNRENIIKSKIKRALPVGVYYYKSTKKYAARITINNKQKHLGYFFNPEEASKAYQKALNQIK